MMDCKARKARPWFPGLSHVCTAALYHALSSCISADFKMVDRELHGRPMSRTCCDLWRQQHVNHVHNVLMEAPNELEVGIASVLIEMFGYQLDLMS